MRRALWGARIVAVPAVQAVLAAGCRTSPSGSEGAEELATAEAGEVPQDARQARNSADDTGYTGPCPPEGDDPHTYRFTVYALDRRLDAESGADARDVLDAIAEPAVARGRLTATFERLRRPARRSSWPTLSRCCSTG